MIEVFKNLFRFLVFRNVFIALCAVCMVCETQWFFKIPLQIFPLIFFIFFATFFEYNLHSVAWRLSLSKPFEVIHQLFSKTVSPTLRFCIITGLLGSLITFCLLRKEWMLGFFLTALFTLAYSLPLIKRNGKFIRMREITYVKVFSVALGWSLITVIVPLLPSANLFSREEILIIFLRRFLFIYAITIPFEIRDMEREKNYGNVSLPMIYGVKMMKVVGLIMLLFFCLLSAMQEKYFSFDIVSRKAIFYPLVISALSAAFLILFASDKKSNWYLKFWTDGTMVLQFLLLLLFNQ